MCISWNPHPIATKRNTFNYDMEIGLYRDDGLAVQDLSLICICKPKSFPPVSEINSSQTNKALPLPLACLIICEISLFVAAANREAI